jgi:hypothetical protein
MRLVETPRRGVHCDVDGVGMKMEWIARDEVEVWRRCLILTNHFDTTVPALYLIPFL